MQVRLLRTLACRPCAAFPDGTKPAGTVINHPHAYKLVTRGLAKPMDAEAKSAARAYGRQSRNGLRVRL